MHYLDLNFLNCVHINSFRRNISHFTILKRIVCNGFGYTNCHRESVQPEIAGCLFFNTCRIIVGSYLIANVYLIY